MNNIINNFIDNVLKKNPFKFLEELFTQNQGMIYILKYLYNNENVKAGDLATSLNVSTARIALLLKKLEKQELVTRTISTKDARITLVSITKKGEIYIENKMESFKDKLLKVIETIGLNKFEEFVNTAGSINKILSN